MNTPNNKVGKPMKFQELWLRECAVIVIPKIQRDFAYGRDNNEFNRTRFLDALCEQIAPGSTQNLKLDFVFGRQYTADEKVFEPIDGQQRLTILFLMHVYLAKRMQALGEEVNTEYLSKFRYETRDSSQEFCRKLLDIAPIHFLSGVTQYIKEQWWYNSVWKADPTIYSMLVILTDIHSRINRHSPEQLRQVWANLNDLIDFWYITLDDLGSSDSLYIKMNSRGKKLTDFEHFKAELDRYAGSGEISMKIDTAWTRMLWPYRNNRGQERDTIKDYYTDNGLNERFHNLFYRLLVIEGSKRGAIEYPADKVYGQMPILVLAEKVLSGVGNDVLERISIILDFFAGEASVDDFFSKFLTDSYSTEFNPVDEDHYRVYYSAGTNLLKRATEERMPFVETLMLEAFLEYAYRCGKGIKIPENEFKNRLRILRNLQNNLQARAEDMVGELLRTDRIVSLCDVGSNMVQDSFTHLQKNQEMMKLEWMRKHSAAERLALLHTENSRFLYGNLAPVMPSPGALDVKYMQAFFKLFDGQPDLDQIKCALLSQGDYATHERWMKKYATDEWKSWYDDIFVFDNKGAFARAFVKWADSGLTCTEAISQFLDQCHASRRYPWRYYLVKYALMRNNQRHRAYTGLYKVGSGKYDYMMRVGSRGRSWNPYLVQLNAMLPGSWLGDDDSRLYYYGLRIYTTNASLYICNAEGKVLRRHYIPQSPDGIDMVDRVRYALQLIAPSLPPRRRKKNNPKHKKRKKI